MSGPIWLQAPKEKKGIKNALLYIKKKKKIISYAVTHLLIEEAHNYLTGYLLDLHSGSSVATDPFSPVHITT